MTKLRTDNHREALRYLENASEILRTKAIKDGRFYQDAKYVRIASGTAYNAVLLALQAYLDSKGMAIVKPRNGHIDVDDYRQRIGNLDKKLLKQFNSAYNILHLLGYYDGELNAAAINAGMSVAADIINKIKPSSTGPR